MAEIVTQIQGHQHISAIYLQEIRDTYDQCRSNISILPAILSPFLIYSDFSIGFSDSISVLYPFRVLLFYTL